LKLTAEWSLVADLWVGPIEEERGVGLVNRVRPRIGDVIEIPTPEGLGYAHYTHKHDQPPRWGALLRVLPGLYEKRPASFAVLVEQTPQFSIFFPLGAACNRRLVRIVANEVVAPRNRAFPIFRNAHRDRSGKRVPPWFLWDGSKEWRVKELTAEQIREYPPLAVCNDTALVWRITTRWTHEQDV
jgi:hypothetical protein